MDEAGDGIVLWGRLLSIGETTDRSAGSNGIPGRVWWCWWMLVEKGGDEMDPWNKLGIENSCMNGSVGRIAGGGWTVAAGCRGELAYWRLML